MKNTILKFIPSSGIALKYNNNEYIVSTMFKQKKYPRGLLGRMQAEKEYERLCNRHYEVKQYATQANNDYLNDIENRLECYNS